MVLVRLAEMRQLLRLGSAGAGTNQGGAGGTGEFFNTSTFQTIVNAAGNPPGGGGGGGAVTGRNQSAAGAAGAAGRIIISWACPLASISYGSQPYCGSLTSIPVS